MHPFKFKDLFSYTSIELCKDFPERDSDSYVDCVMLKTVDDLMEGQHIPFICVSLELISDDLHSYLYDRDSEPPFPFIYKYSSVDVTEEYEGSNRTDRAYQYQEVIYYDCEMLQDVGEFIKGEEYSNIIVIMSLFAFNDKGELI
jgi:hypothetical protein